MLCLSGQLHNPHWVSAMKTQTSSIITQPARPAVFRETEESGFGRLEVNVIFTEPRATMAALKTAGLLARDLGASIQVRAAIAVPYALPLDKPPVSVTFIEDLLCRMVRRVGLDRFEPSVHLYECRDRTETFLQVLKPHSLVVICGRKHWWPTAESRMAKVLRSKGHRVVLIGLQKNAESDLPCKGKCNSTDSTIAG
jgi:hypothetical protein